ADGFVTFSDVKSAANAGIEDIMNIARQKINAINIFRLFFKPSSPFPIPNTSSPFYYALVQKSKRTVSLTREAVFPPQKANRSFSLLP
ncbi:MAG: hypothetical protein ACI4IA_08010, partial [Acutalibacteraceae bacterium]